MRVIDRPSATVVVGPIHTSIVHQRINKVEERDWAALQNMESLRTCTTTYVQEVRPPSVIRRWPVAGVRIEPVTIWCEWEEVDAQTGVVLGCDVLHRRSGLSG